MFKRENFNETKTSHLKFNDDFCIGLGEKSKIIYGPNGSGKTSIYKNIMERKSEYGYIDYDELKNLIIGKKKNLSIGAKINLIDEKMKAKNNKINDLNLKDNIESFDIKNKGQAGKVSTAFSEIFKDYEKCVLSFSSINLAKIKNIGNNASFLVKNFKELAELIDIESQLDGLNNLYIKKAFDNLEKVLLAGEMQCPICSTIKEEPIVDIIRRKREGLNILTNNLIKEYIDLNDNLDSRKVVENINEIKKFINDEGITSEQATSYLLIGGELANISLNEQTKTEVATISNEILELETERDNYYNNLLERREKIIEIFNKEFQVSQNDIKFNNDTKTIEIKLDREVKTYSTGEINLLVLILSINEFIASNKEILVVDDPLTSYDIKNQYRIVYELISTISTNKKILIFTHNINTVNIVNSQYRGIFEYEGIEKINGKLYINSVLMNQGDSILNVENLLSRINNNDSFYGYLKLLVEKDDLDDNADEHLIFHYDSQKTLTYDSKDLDNEYLVGLIDQFSETTFNNEKFEDNAKNKIIYVAALRVWLEKQFFLKHPTDIGLHNKKLGEKIMYLFGTDPIRWSGNQNITKEFLMSRKVMLNQHEHYKSQIIPFHYALSLSLDEIKTEILEIKEIFLQTP